MCVCAIMIVVPHYSPAVSGRMAKAMKKWLSVPAVLVFLGLGLAPPGGASDLKAGWYANILGAHGNSAGGN